MHTCKCNIMQTQDITLTVFITKKEATVDRDFVLSFSRPIPASTMNLRCELETGNQSSVCEHQAGRLCRR